MPKEIRVSYGRLILVWRHVPVTVCKHCCLEEKGVYCMPLRMSEERRDDNGQIVVLL